MNWQTHLRRLIILVYILLGVGAAVLLLPGLLPFLLGLALALLLEGLVKFLTDRLKLGRIWASALTVTVFAALLLTGGFFLLRRLWYELTLLGGLLPEVLETVNGLSDKADTLLYRVTVAVPPAMREGVLAAWEALLDRLRDLLTTLGGRLLARAAGFLTALPRAALFLVTTLLSAFFISSGRPALFPFFRRQIPQKWLPRLEQLIARCKDALSGWLRAQGILLAVTFALLCTGFLLMGLDLALLLAAGVALLDALPVIGTGTFLIPWAAFSLLRGNFPSGVSLLVLYAAIWITRSTLEPKLIARQAGLHPLAALVSMYLGFSLFGVPGMLLAPLAAVILLQLHSSRVIRLWK